MSGPQLSSILSALVIATLGTGTIAQTSQSTTGNSNVTIGNNNQFVNTGEITFILNSEAAMVIDQSQRQALQDLSQLLSELTSSGEIALSETAARKLARNAVASLANQPLTRNVISQRQFTIPYNQTYNIAGTRNRITYTKGNCGGNYGIGFTFNREKDCVRNGGTYTFVDDGVEYDLVFDGYTDDTKTEAQFTLYPTQ